MTLVIYESFLQGVGAAAFLFYMGSILPQINFFARWK
jgi:hypothetical protein